MNGPLSLRIDAAPPDRRSRDIDNILKAVMDALQAAGVYHDDTQVDDLHVVRLPVNRTAGIICTITETTNHEKEPTC